MKRHSPSAFIPHITSKRRLCGGFTLIELLVVIGVLAILSTATVLVLNPAELLKGARDSTRLSDLASLNRALTLFQTDQYNLSLGNASTTYVSIPDSSPTCANLGLPTLPSGWSYSCAPTSTFTNINGSGWIPVNLTLLSSKTSISKLPVDPINTTSTGQYYTYTPGGSWELTAIPESQKQKINLQTNPSIQNVPGVIAVGSNLSLSPLFNTNGLVGYWPLDGSANDASGNNNNGTWSGTQTNGSYYTGGKIGQAGNFNGTDDYVDLGNVALLNNLANYFTVSAWVKTNANNISQAITSRGNDWIFYKSNGAYVFEHRNASQNIVQATYTNTSTAWIHIVSTFSKDEGYARLYMNGVLVNSAAQTGTTRTGQTQNYIGSDYLWHTDSTYNDRFFNGSIDDVRIYNRALSAAEVQAIYNATR